MRLSPDGSSVRARLLAASPRVLQKGRESELLEHLAGLAHAAFPEPFGALRLHPLFAIGAPTPSVALREAFADLPPAERLIGLHELYREATSDRRATGVYYTPTWLASVVAARSFARLGSPTSAAARLTDPACGAGAFLAAALRLRLAGEAGPDRRREIAESFIGGTDTDEHAVSIARAAISLLVAEGSTGPATELALPRLRVVDPLHEVEVETADIVLGNPPYLDAKARARQSTREGAFLRRRFPDLRGPFDLFVAFVLRALELLRPGGVAGLVLPDKVLSAAYAAGLRERLLKDTSLVEIVDLAPQLPFPEAAVFPVYLGFSRRPPDPLHRVAFGVLSTEDVVHVQAEVVQTTLSAATFLWRPPLRSARELVPLGSRMDISAGTAGFEARALLDALRDEHDEPRDPEGCPFVVTGSIDRYALRQGPVRFLKRVFRRPFLPASAVDKCSAGRKALFRAPKLVLAGMGKRLEATFVPTPLALGVATYGAIACAGDPLAYLAVLNSAWASHAYLERHGARRLSGGYVTFHRRELAQLPVPRLTDAEEANLASLAARRLAACEPAHDAEAARLEATIEEAISGILGLPASDRASIAARFALPPRRR